MVRKVGGIWLMFVCGILGALNVYAQEDSLGVRLEFKVDSLERGLVGASVVRRMEILKQLHMVWREVRPMAGYYYALEYDRLAKKLRDPLAMFWGRRMVAFGLSEALSDDLGSVRCNLECLDILSGNKGNAEMARMEKIIRNNLGFSYSNIGLYGEALKEYLKAYRLKISEVPVNRVSVANTLNNIGLVYLYLNSYGKAITYLKQANAYHSTVATYTNLGLCFQNQGNMEMCKKYFDSAALACGGRCTSRYELGFLAGYADYYSEVGEYTKAEGILAEVLRKSGEVNSVQYYETAWIVLSKVYFKRGEYELSKKAISKIGTRELRFGTKINELSYFYRLWKAFVGMGKVDSAAYYRRVYFERVDSLFSSNLAKNVKGLEDLYALKKGLKQKGVEKVDGVFRHVGWWWLVFPCVLVGGAFWMWYRGLWYRNLIRVEEGFKGVVKNVLV